MDFYCKLDYDPFILLEETGAKYGFNIAIKELMATIPTLSEVSDKFRALEKIPNTRPLMALFEERECGMGWVGNGICPDKSCCSVFGW